jgi:hypothetical protein
MDLPNGCMDCPQILGECEPSLGDATPKILDYQTNQNDENHQTTELKPLLRVPSRTHESKAKSSVWGG